jgi:hypothetical protein
VSNSPLGSIQFETAGSEVLASLRSKVAGETGEMEEPVTGDVQIFLSSKENCVSMRSIGVSSATTCTSYYYSQIADFRIQTVLGTPF